jgi:hypothetical protein
MPCSCFPVLSKVFAETFETVLREAKICLLLLISPLAEMRLGYDNAVNATIQTRVRQETGRFGHVYSVCFAGAGAADSSRVMPHFGQFPGPGRLISGCIGQVYSRSSAIFACVGNGDDLDYSARSFLVRGALICNARRGFRTNDLHCANRIVILTVRHRVMKAGFTHPTTPRS